MNLMPCPQDHKEKKVSWIDLPTAEAWIFYLLCSNVNIEVSGNSQITRFVKILMLYTFFPFSTQLPIISCAYLWTNLGFEDHISKLLMNSRRLNTISFRSFYPFNECYWPSLSFSSDLAQKAFHFLKVKPSG